MEERTPAQVAAVLLAEITEMRRRLDRVEYETVSLLRAVGVTWDDIGEELGISRQAARERYERVRTRRAPKE